MSGKEKLTTIPKTVRRSFIRAAIIPFLFVEVTFLCIYWLSVTISNDQSIQLAVDAAYDSIQIHTLKAAKRIDHQLTSIQAATKIFASQTSWVLNSDDATKIYADNLALSPDGVYHTTHNNGGSSVYYSAINTIDKEQKEKVAVTATLDPLMKSIHGSNDLIQQVYINTYDSYNRLYPYINTLTTFSSEIDLIDFNFYYLADLKHNPKREAVWTDAYLDPAGSGWMISSIAPVYSTAEPDKLEAVVGVDITLRSIIKEMLNIQIGWLGYAMIIDQNGSIIAMPERAEKDFALKELTSHQYTQHIDQDQFKPSRFNLKTHPKTQEYISTLLSTPQGSTLITLNNPMIMSWAQVPGTDWKLVFLAPSKQIERRYFDIKQNLANIGWLMVAGLFFFYLIFFFYITHRSARIGESSVSELNSILKLVQSIGQGNYQQQKPRMKFAELDNLANHVVEMGNKLGDAYNAIAKAEYHAGHDKLTGLPNRYLMEDYLKQSIALAQRHHQKIAVVFIDLDKFKQVNDQLGHYVGDIVLQSVASRIQRNLRKSDIVARLGGDEFIVILNDIEDTDPVINLIDALKESISQPIAYKTGSCTIEASMGYAIYPDHANNSQDLVNYADEEMYKQKPVKNTSSTGSVLYR
ncbi:hypothetical protein DS893_15390 [Vibrionales bacterium C3R12]|nr:hypothetical protein DS893_15390 [Vibrionales bacterium C3R12]